MKKLRLSIFSFFLTSVIFALLSVGHAAVFQLTSIGALATGGKTYSEWWYTGVNPTLKGVAAAGSDVSIKIGDSTHSVTAGSDGIWSYSPTTLTSGDHQIILTSGSESYSFTLHAGQNLPANLGGTSEATQSTTSVPATGSSQIMVLFLSLFLITFGYMVYRNSVVAKSFERNTLKGL